MYLSRVGFLLSWFVCIFFLPTSLLSLLLGFGMHEKVLSTCNDQFFLARCLGHNPKWWCFLCSQKKILHDLQKSQPLEFPFTSDDLNHPERSCPFYLFKLAVNCVWSVYLCVCALKIVSLYRILLCIQTLIFLIFFLLVNVKW